MMRTLLTKTLHDRRRGLVGWSVGIAALVALIALYWPSVRDSPDLQAFTRDLPDAVRALVGDADFSTAHGYLHAELFSFMVPLLFLIVAIGMGARAVAAEEERGTIDVLMALPISRHRMLLEKVAAGALVLVALGAVLALALLAAGALVDLGIPAGRFVAVALATVLLAGPFGALALAIGCATASRGLAVGVAGAAAAVAYLLDALAPLVASLEPYRDLSPFAWYRSDELLAGAGLALGDVALFVGVSAALAALALLALERRDLGT